LPPCNARQAEDTFVSAKRNKHIWAKKQAQIFSSTNKRRDLKGRGAGVKNAGGKTLGYMLAVDLQSLASIG
jgi:1,2-phenylacetyl-CoA epoxidase PaaB subunit